MNKVTGTIKTTAVSIFHLKIKCMILCVKATRSCKRTLIHHVSILYGPIVVKTAENMPLQIKIKNTYRIHDAT